MASRAKGKQGRGRPGADRASTGHAEHIGRLYRDIHAVIRRIPHGRVATYGQVAELAGIPGGARVVGAALRVSTPELGLPWQRVVGKRSAAMAQVSIHDPVGAGLQTALLKDEGVVFTDAGGIRLAEFGWLPRERAPRQARAQARGRAPGRARTPDDPRRKRKKRDARG